jgi:recombination protein RecA
MAAVVPAAALVPVQTARLEHLSGLPRGAVSEVTGARSSGRTSFLNSVLAEATSREEYCAVVDASDHFDPFSAARAGVALERLVWVRCAGNAEHALKAADLLLHGGGFGVVCLDLAGVPARVLNRIPLSYWFRFRRAVQDTPTVFLLLGVQPQAKSCAACWIEFRQNNPIWSGSKPFRLLRGLRVEAVMRKPGPPRAILREQRAI